MKPDAEHIHKAVVLLSGGLDSATALAIAHERGFECYALAVSYGQRHAAELAHAEKIATVLGATEYKTIGLDLRRFGGSALTDDIDVPKERAMDASIPITYVPARNTILLSLALGWAEVLDAHDIFVGVNAVDYSGYPDCRPEFITAFEKTANLATRMGVEGATIKIHAPLITMTKAEIIRTGISLGVDYSLTTSCYDPDSDSRACGRCDACILRHKGFIDAGVKDPTHYQPGVTFNP
jgi:7-cyano-7-deazaguanine synthase